MKNEFQKLADRLSGTRRELAARFGVDEATLSRWLSGKQPPQHPGMLRDALRLVLAEQAMGSEKPEEIFLILRQNNT